MKLTVGAALCALTFAVAQPAVAAPAQGGAVAHAAPGCAGVTVLTPRDGSVATAQAMGMTASADGFYARAAASKATWLSTMSCTKTFRTHALKPAAAAVSTTGVVGAVGSASTIGMVGGASTVGTINSASASTVNRESRIDSAGTNDSASTVGSISTSGGAAVRNAGLVSSNWSGYQINKTAQYAQSGWTVPTVTRPVPAYSAIGYYSSTWSGIGGGFNAGSGALIQSGTSQDISASGVTSYYAWYEIVGGTHDTGGEVRINNLPIHPGDIVGSGVEWAPSGGAILGVCNFSGAGCINFTLASSAPGTSVEWIVEAPYSNGVLPLADFNTVNFINACWQTTFQPSGTCSSIAAGGPQAISLQSYVFGAYQTLAQPEGGLTNSGQNFSDYYLVPERCPTC